MFVFLWHLLLMTFVVLWGLSVMMLVVLWRLSVIMFVALWCLCIGRERLLLCTEASYGVPDSDLKLGSFIKNLHLKPIRSHSRTFQKWPSYTVLLFTSIYYVKISKLFFTWSRKVYSLVAVGNKNEKWLLIEMFVFHILTCWRYKPGVNITVIRKPSKVFVKMTQPTERKKYWISHNKKTIKICENFYSCTVFLTSFLEEKNYKNVVVHL